MPASMLYDDLLALHGRDCRLSRAGDDGGEDLVATLTQVGERRRRGEWEEFSLLFRVAVSGLPRQGLYNVMFDGDDAREMFLVPVGREGAHVVYEASFNRIAGAA